METNNSATLACINCGINLRRKWRALALDQREELITYIRENISRNRLTKNDYICKECSQLSVKIIDTSEIKSENEDDPMPHSTLSVKHSLQEACLVCGTSLISRQSRVVLRDNPTEIDLLMYKVIQKALTPNTEIRTEDKLCTKCWVTAKRSACILQNENNEHQSLISNQSENEDSNLSNSSSEDEEFPENGYDEPLISPIKSEPEDEDSNAEIIIDDTSENMSDNETEDEKQSNNESEDEKQSNNETDNEESDKSESYRDDPEDLDFTVPSYDYKRKKTNISKEPQRDEPDEPEQIIKLVNYKRSPNSSHVCIFNKCNSPRRLHIPEEARVKVLRDHHFYITKGARICPQHLTNYERHSWDKLYSQRGISTFRVKDVEHAISLVQTQNKKLDFHNVLALEDHLFKFLLGITKETYSAIIKKIPSLQKMQMGLVGLLIYHHNESNNLNKLSHLLNICRSTLRRAMTIVKEKLETYPHKKELGIENVLKENKSYRKCTSR